MWYWGQIISRRGDTSEPETGATTPHLHTWTHTEALFIILSEDKTFIAKPKWMTEIIVILSSCVLTIDQFKQIYWPTYFCTKTVYSLDCIPATSSLGGMGFIWGCKDICSHVYRAFALVPHEEIWNTLLPPSSFSLPPHIPCPPEFYGSHEA